MCIITVRFHGVVGYHICFTYIGSPVRTRVEPFLYLCSFLSDQTREERERRKRKKEKKKKRKKRNEEERKIKKKKRRKKKK